MTDYMRDVLDTMQDDTVNPFAKVLTLAKAMTNVLQWESGSVTGTGADLEVETSGAPKLVILTNITQDVIAFWHYGMSAATAYILDNAPAFGIGADGITGSASSYDYGFTIGTNALLNTLNDDIRYTVIY